MKNHSWVEKAGFVLLVVGLSLSRVGTGTAGEPVPPLQKRNLSKRVDCPGLSTLPECNQYKEDYSLVSCPDGDMILGGMGATDDSFQVWCGASAQGRHVKAITCPDGTVARAGVSYMSNVWTLRCERRVKAGAGDDPSRFELQGPFFEWYSSDGKLQQVVSGHFDSDRPVGYWLEEDASGKLVAAGKMTYSHESVNHSEKDGEWLEWEWNTGNWRRFYYIRGEGPFDQRQEYLQELKTKAARPGA